MGLIGRAYERFAFFALYNVQEESEKQTDVAIAVLLYQNHEELLMFVNWLTSFQQSGNMLSYFDYYICQILFVLLVVQGHKHFFYNFFEIFLVGLFLIT